jgi:hypothetical protein
MVVATVDAKKKYDAACAWVLATTILLKEEQHTAVILIEEARISVAMIEPPSPTLTLAPTGRATRSDDDYEAAVITNIHVQATGMQNIHSQLGRTGPLLRRLCPVARQCRAHPQALLSLRSRAPRHDICQCFRFGPDRQPHQVVDLGHHLP